MQNVKTRPGADCGSDHQLLVATFQLKLRVRRTHQPPVRYDVDSIPSQFTLEVRNRFSQLLQISEVEQTPNELWENMKEVVQTSAKKHIPKKKRKKKQPRITKRTLNLADERRSATA